MCKLFLWLLALICMSSITTVYCGTVEERQRNPEKLLEESTNPENEGQGCSALQYELDSSQSHIQKLDNENKKLKERLADLEEQNRNETKVKNLKRKLNKKTAEIKQMKNNTDAERKEMLAQIAVLEANMKYLTSHLDSCKKTQCLEDKLLPVNSCNETCVQQKLEEAKQTVEEYRISEDLVDDNNWIMSIACCYGNIPVMAALLDLGITCETRLGWHDWNCLHYVSECQRNPEATSFLINQGCDVNIRNDYGGTPLIQAAYKGHLSVVKELVKRGADVSLRAKDNLTALGKAKQVQQEEVVKYLQSINAPE